MNKTNHHIYKAEQIDWEKLESVGISKLQIEKDGNMDLLLQGKRKPMSCPLKSRLLYFHLQWMPHSV